ncbi:hypothetical protein B0T10DRAFT_95638 [Thelonectria olida]|uniref:Uncharacterized protein n=1 Tax=Thelonectria olida TaxID=1576542 RepID=A0A9P8W261_9HYPO|nr:hypothetical protein B0T10DRAFT_95638 [Thelonectria olida]
MNRLFSRSGGPRRNTDEDPNKTQFWTPRGVIPAKAINDEVQKVGIPHRDSHGCYPHEYRNEEANGVVPIRPHEIRDPDNRKLFEVPVNTRADLATPAAPLRAMQRQQGVHHNDRGRVVRGELNDPGPFRAIVPAYRETDQKFGATGVLYHPEDNPRGFERATVEPMDREGRQYMRRFEDDNARRTSTWPPRDEDADDLITYENRYEKVRRGRNAPPRERRRRAEVVG